tara:strand:+ start:75 stop:203 length:129 start_codon:yes stop_codon:yes gene_type:complete
MSGKKDATNLTLVVFGIITYLIVVYIKAVIEVGVGLYKIIKK